MSTEQKATIRWFNVGKGFGFAETEAGQEVFIYGQEFGGDMH